MHHISSFMNQKGVQLHWVKFISLALFVIVINQVCEKQCVCGWGIEYHKNGFNQQRCYTLTRRRTERERSINEFGHTEEENQPARKKEDPKSQVVSKAHSMPAGASPRK